MHGDNMIVRIAGDRERPDAVAAIPTEEPGPNDKRPPVEGATVRNVVVVMEIATLMQLAIAPQESSEEECTSKTDPSSFFGRLPDVWARDPRISDADLCTLGYRCTFADDKSPFGLYQDTLSKTPIFSSGYCENVRSRSFRHLKQLSIMERPHNSTLPREAGGAFARPIDRLIYPSECTSAHSRQVFRGWHDGTVSCKAMALLHFMNAGTGKGPRVYRREIEERFGWSKKTTLKTLRELRRRWDPAEGKALVEERKDLNEKNRIVGCYYVLNVDLLEPKLPPPLPEEQADANGQMDFTPGSFPASRDPANRDEGDIRILPSTEVSPSRNTLVQDTSPLPPNGGRCDEFFREDLSSPERSERYVLPDWKSCDVLRGRVWKRASAASPPFDLATWTFWLDQYGGAPAHARTRRAHLQAAEIACELHAVVEGVMSTAVCMVGVAFALADAHRRGHPINSLGFIAAPLLR